MIDNEKTAFAFTFGQEGDETVSLDPDDKGNWSLGEVGQGTLIGTKFGVSAPVLISWYQQNRLGTVTPSVMANLTQDVADAIIGTKFWNAMNCPNLPSGVDLSVNDHGFNAGNGVSVRLLQQIAGAAADGNCGRLTLAAVGAFSTVTYGQAHGFSRTALEAVQAALGLEADGYWGPLTQAAIMATPQGSALGLCAALYDAQLADYVSIGLPKYIHGWSNRCLARLKAAVALATTPTPSATSN